MVASSCSRLERVSGAGEHVGCGVLRPLRAETHRTVLREVRPRLRGDCRSAACQLSFGNRNSAACRLFGDRRRAAGRLFFDSQSAAGRLSCDRRSAAGSLSYFTSYGYCGICPARHECCLLHSLNCVRWHACEEKRETLWCRHMLAARCESLVLGSQAGPAKRHAAVTVFAACRWAHSDVTLHLCSLKRECISPLRKCRQALSLLAYTPVSYTHLTLPTKRIV